jgi:hypothetical protein
VERCTEGIYMGFEFWLNGIKYEYKDLKTVSIVVDKHDLEHGDMLEHTEIKIETRPPPDAEAKLKDAMHNYKIEYDRAEALKVRLEEARVNANGQQAAIRTLVADRDEIKTNLEVRLEAMEKYSKEKLAERNDLQDRLAALRSTIDDRDALVLAQRNRITALEKELETSYKEQRDLRESLEKIIKEQGMKLASAERRAIETFHRDYNRIASLEQERDMDHKKIAQYEIAIVAAEKGVDITLAREENIRLNKRIVELVEAVKRGCGLRWDEKEQKELECSEVKNCYANCPLNPSGDGKGGKVTKPLSGGQRAPVCTDLIGSSAPETPEGKSPERIKNEYFQPEKIEPASNTPMRDMICRGCGKPLLLENIYVDDGCPCNSQRGVNFQPRPCSICGTEACVKPAHHLPELFPSSQPSIKPAKTRGKCSMCGGKKEIAGIADLCPCIHCKGTGIEPSDGNSIPSAEEYEKRVGFPVQITCPICKQIIGVELAPGESLSKIKVLDLYHMVYEDEPPHAVCSICDKAVEARMTYIHGEEQEIVMECPVHGKLPPSDKICCPNCGEEVKDLEAHIGPIDLIADIGEEYKCDKKSPAGAKVVGEAPKVTPIAGSEGASSISAIPAGDKKGWKYHPNSRIMGNGFTCNKCGVNYNYMFNYCPDCGLLHEHHPHDTPYWPLHYPLGLIKGRVLEDGVHLGPLKESDENKYELIPPRELTPEEKKNLDEFMKKEKGKARNLQEGLIDELKRNRELLEVYKKIPTGGFGLAAIQMAITIGEIALKSGDAVEMLRAYVMLKNSK